MNDSDATAGSGAASRRPSRQRDFLTGAYLSTEEGVYGLILVAGLIAVAGTSGLSSWQTLVFVGVTVIVFWAAHVYAGSVAAHSGSTGISLRGAIRHALRRSRGLLAATVPTAIPLVLGAIGVLDTALADWISLWIVVGVLALHGFLAYQRKGSPVHMRVIGAVSTAAFGVVIILAKALLHFE